MDSSGVCQQITCQCPNGEVDNDSSCSLIDSIRCLTCDQGFILEADSNSGSFFCARPNCNCKNGHPAENACTQQNQEKCSNCTENFHLLNEICHPNQCLCSNGYPVDSDHCLENNSEVCKSCAIGFELENSKCVETKGSVLF